MSNLTRIKLVVGALGIAIWGVGIRLGDDRLRWAGIGLLAGAFLLRLLNGRTRL